MAVCSAVQRGAARGACMAVALSPSVPGDPLSRPFMPRIMGALVSHTGMGQMAGMAPQGCAGLRAIAAHCRKKQKRKRLDAAVPAARQGWCKWEESWIRGFSSAPRRVSVCFAGLNFGFGGKACCADSPVSQLKRCQVLAVSPPLTQPRHAPPPRTTPAGQGFRGTKENKGVSREGLAEEVRVEKNKQRRNNGLRHLPCGVDARVDGGTTPKRRL